MNTTSADVRDEVAPSRPPSVAIRLASGGLPARAEAPFREDLAWSIAASILYALSQAASIVVLVKFTSAADVGQWGLGFAIATPAFLLANLYLRTVQASDASGEFDLADHLGLRLVTTCVATVALVAGTVAWSGSLHAAAVILIVVLIKAVDAVCDILCGHFFQRAAVKAAAVTMLVNAVTSWVALSVAVIASGSVVLGAAGSLVGSCVALAYAARVVAANYGAAALVPRFGLETMRRLATRAAPLGLAGMRSSLHASVPRVAVAYALGEAAVGLFTALSAAAALGGFLTVPVAQAALPRLARARAAGDSRAFRLLVAHALGLVALAAGSAMAASAIWGRPFLGLVFNAEHAHQAPVFLWLMAAAGFQQVCAVLEAVLTSLGRTWLLVVAQVPGLMVLAAACSVVVPRGGLAGAGVASCAAALVVVVGFALAAASSASALDRCAERAA